MTAKGWEGRTVAVRNEQRLQLPRELSEGQRARVDVAAGRAHLHQISAASGRLVRPAMLAAL